MRELTDGELKILCDTVVELTRIKVAETPHLCVENFSAELFSKMLAAYAGDTSGEPHG